MRLWGRRTEWREARMAPAWMPGKGLAAGMLHWPVARVLKFCEGIRPRKREAGEGLPARGQGPQTGQ